MRNLENVTDRAAGVVYCREDVAHGFGAQAADVDECPDQPQALKVGVVGATGGTGAAVVGQALERGWSVTALVRNGRAGVDPAAGVITGDVRDAGTVGTALAGVDAVVCCLGVRIGQPAGTVRSEGTANLARQMHTHGVARIVAVSTVGVGSSVADQSRTARLLWPRLAGRDRLAEADRAEAEIRDPAHGLAWTLVRPPRLTDAPVSGHVAVGPSVRTGLRSQLSRADLAAVLLDQLTDDRYRGMAVTALNP